LIERQGHVRGSEFGLFASGRLADLCQTRALNRAAGTGGRSSSWPSATLDKLKDQFCRFHT
jgi:hypothetical protein